MSVLVATVKKKKKKEKGRKKERNRLNEFLIICFLGITLSKILSFQRVINIKIVVERFHILFLNNNSLESGVYFTFTEISQFGRKIFFGNTWSVLKFRKIYS